MAKSGPQTYPGASLAHWYQGAYAGDAMETNTIVWHSTEGTSLPTYSGGAIAPTLTAVPNWSKRRLDWYQHFGFDTSARALANRAGGVETNTLNVCQVEIVGTCDPATHKRWGSTPHLYMPELPDWAVRDLGAFARWAHDQHGVPLTSGVKFKAYPSSYGANGVRMSGAKWEAYSGHCGHQHVPENDHGDPGSLPMAAILAAARDNGTSSGGSTSTPSKPPKAKYEPFPGGDFFRSGRRSPVIAAMHKRLVAEGCNRYQSSANADVWGSGDERSYAAWQRKCGYSGTSADGVPGKASWDKLRVPNV
ncbi:peptidoglycan-binding protein [Streptomyces sp. Isolate_219]|uniref:peptidoglycan-binding protein n=1 Tax=Streptomyces sp. Isolate_219 TaxID=2950110 RepID=UPI0021C83E19|nr:peptidoglycan-binding protein [Streptomyces sp. Isolate_219]MCR8574663.1 peptidoglycan-binding protein [Streptomyces sp. Isolate_219]